MAASPRLKQAILDVVENQLRSNDPPETQQALQRLLAAGYSRQQAVERIAAALVKELWQILHERQRYDQRRYVAWLDKIE
jgi:hypothetical protein